jgi:hypothetical protein
MVETERTTHYLLVTHKFRMQQVICELAVHSSITLTSVCSNSGQQVENFYMIVYDYHRFIIHLIQHTLL